MPCAPVVILPFARPNNLVQVLAQVRVAAPQILYIGSDGPREGRPDDVELIAQVRAVVADQVDWDCDVRRICRERNLGVQGNAELTLDAVFAEVATAIVLDDDCVPDPSFFRFCTELLERYADDQRIMHIAGCNEEIDSRKFDGLSYAFTAFGSNWGWATWARAWQAHRTVFARPHDDTTELVWFGRPATRFMPVAGPRDFRPVRHDLQTRSGRAFFADVAEGKDHSLAEWGQQWRLSVLNLGGLAITPATNMIENVGFAPGSDSHLPERVMKTASATTFPLRHPPRVEVQPAVERALERNIVRAVGRLARRFRRHTPAVLKGPARRLASILVR
ncbi:MAG: hypothetical protein M3O28_07885 [Actinomycetota bacterium]|nr:hypothetical protein [Actinomycetota bacterium]